MEKYGSSLPVANVQILAAANNGSGEIPDRYIRPEVKDDLVIRDVNNTLPVIDLGRLLDPQLTQEESSKLDLACEEWGFFQLINHGIPTELIDKMKVDITEFFKLPLKEKETFAQLPDNIEGYGHAFVKSEEQKLDWGDLLILVTRPPAARNMRFWPTHPPTFRDTMEKYSLAVKEVASSLLRLLASNLGLDPEIILSIFKEQPQSVRINYYPPCPKADKVLGISPHSDAAGLTLLLQVNDVQGLQIRKNGKWFPVEPLPGAFIVNIGDMIEILSNGKYKSIEHRAIINPEKERLTIAAFHGPSYDSTVGPLPELVKGGEEKYKTISCENYMKIYLASKLDGKSIMESVKL